MLFALMLAAVTAASPQAGTYRYAASMAGQSVGSWSVNVVRDAAQTQVEESSSAAVFGMQLAATASLVLGPDLSPIRYTGGYRTPTQNLTTNVALTSNSAVVSDAMTGQSHQVALIANTRHFAVIEPGLLAGLFVLPAQLAAWQETSLTWLTPAIGQAQLLTIATAPAPARPAGVSPNDAVIAVDRPIAVTIWYDPATFAPDQIAVPSQNAVLTRVPIR